MKLLLSLGVVFTLTSCGDFNNEFPAALVEAEACSVPGIQQHVIDAGFGPNEPVTEDYFSAVWVAASGAATSGSDDRCVAALTMLLDAGGSVEGQEYGWSILGVAARQQENPAVVDFLVERGADPCMPIGDHVSFDASAFDGEIFSTLAEVAEIYERPTSVVDAFTRVESRCPDE